MKRPYKKITWEDRLRIEKMLKEGTSVARIAETIGTHRHSIYREKNRGIGEDGFYHAEIAQKTL